MVKSRRQSTLLDLLYKFRASLQGARHDDRLWHGRCNFIDGFVDLQTIAFVSALARQRQFATVERLLRARENVFAERTILKI